MTLAAIWGLTSLRSAVMAGGVALAVLGAWMIQQTLASAHFEGYALLLGGLLVVQGLMTLGAFALPHRGGLDRGFLR